MTNAERILTELDSRLGGPPVELTLYGRAALLLGFDDPPEQFAQSLDVDAVLWVGQAEELREAGNFWEAVQEVNEALAPEGLYMSHLFVEDQVILTAQWREERKPVDGPWRMLRLFRLADVDLLLSKLMRDDPQDRQDALFIVNRRSWTRGDVAALTERAQVPDIQELDDQFRAASAKLIASLPA